MFYLTYVRDGKLTDCLMAWCEMWKYCVEVDVDFQEWLVRTYGDQHTLAVLLKHEKWPMKIQAVT